MGIAVCWERISRRLLVFFFFDRLERRPMKEAAPACANCPRLPNQQDRTKQFSAKVRHYGHDVKLMQFDDS